MENKCIDVPKKNPFHGYLESKESKDSKFSNINSKIGEKNYKNNSSLNCSKNEKNSDKYHDIEKMKDFLSLYCKEFSEKFELLEALKSGSAGAVYKGQLRKHPDKPNSTKLIAFKFLFDNNKENKEKKTKEKSKKFDKNKHLEISIHGLLKNKHIPEIYGYYKIENSSCIAMEFNKYGDLENFKRKILKRASLSETLVCYIAGGILEALFYIHVKNKIIHMDIKQQNILIDDFLMVKLTDFSVSINYKNYKDYINLPMVGTCYYMSPEVLSKASILVNEASKIDIYSFGVLLYLLAFCDYPYNLNDVNSKDYQKILESIQKNELKFPEDTGHSKVFINFLKNCLNKNIKKRYDIYQAINDPWFKGYQIILDEKEKLYNAGKLVIDLMVDNFIKFNDYIKEQEKLIEQLNNKN